ncbi:TIGR04282 family arsenosugar biosynthesis glycosyltransferase [soil metagenome]
MLIFTKNPEKGKIKTRLAATIGNDKAFAVYNQLLAHTVSVTADLEVDKFVFYSENIIHNDIWSNKIYSKLLQSGSMLGDRMHNAFKYIFQNGYSSAVLIGTDCPELTAEIVLKSFQEISSKDVIVGPAFDRGYYLLGMNKLIPELFENILWSTSTVLKDTLNICDKNNLNYSLLPMLHDIDEEKDLIYLSSISKS